MRFPFLPVNSSGRSCARSQGHVRLGVGVLLLVTLAAGSASAQVRVSFALQEFNRAVGQITASDQVRRRVGAPLLDQLTEQANVLHSIFNSASPLAAAAGEEADAVGDYARSILT